MSVVVVVVVVVSAAFSSFVRLHLRVQNVSLPFTLHYLPFHLRLFRAFAFLFLPVLKLVAYRPMLDKPEREREREREESERSGNKPK
jgi:hypothetical protein